MGNRVTTSEHLVSILIPVFNEERGIEAVLSNILEYEAPEGIRFEVIIIDDGSWDKTSAILEKFSPNPMIQTHTLPGNRGKGAAIREALKFAKGDVILIQDADGEYSIQDYTKLLEPIVSGKAQVVYGSRFLGHIEGMKPLNRIFNIGIRYLVNFLFGSSITDEATAYKVLNAELMRSLDLKSNRFEICPEITAKVLKRGIAIYEVPIQYKGRNYSEGKKIRWTDAVTAISTLLKLWAEA